MEDKKVRPGEYLVLKFDFSVVNCSPDLNEAAKSLANSIIGRLEYFYHVNSKYLGGHASQLIRENIDQQNPIGSLKRLVMLFNLAIKDAVKSKDAEHPLANVKGVGDRFSFSALILAMAYNLKIYVIVDEYDTFTKEYTNLSWPPAAWNGTTPAWNGTKAASLVQAFWSTLMAGAQYGIEKIFITGVFPLCLADNTSGFNISMNVSFQERFAGFCGLTQADIRALLEVIFRNKGMAEREAREKVEKCLAELIKYANGFHFCRNRRVEPVFNTNTCLGYLEVSRGIGAPIAKSVVIQALGTHSGVDRRLREGGAFATSATHPTLRFQNAF